MYMPSKPMCVYLLMWVCLLNKHMFLLEHTKEFPAPKCFPQILNMCISQKITISAKGIEEHLKFTTHPPVYVL